MTGNQNKIAWHHTRQHDHLLDRITNYVLRYIDHDERDFAAAPANDERVINGPGVNVPCISLNRWPYEEYHTTDDNLDIMHEDMLVGAADIAEQIVRIYASNYIPKRTFRGPVFLSGNGLWVDWRDNWELNRAIEKIMMRFEGRAFGLRYCRAGWTRLLDGARLCGEIPRQRFCRTSAHSIGGGDFINK